MVGSQEEGFLQGSSATSANLSIPQYFYLTSAPAPRTTGLLVHLIFCFPSLVCCLECRKWLPKEAINYISAFIKGCL